MSRAGGIAARDCSHLAPASIVPDKEGMERVDDIEQNNKLT